LKWMFMILRGMVVIFQRVFYVLTLGLLPPFASVSVLVWKDGKILMIDRVDGKGLGLPGGFVHMHETSEQAAVRETLEETGIEVEITGIVGVLSGRRRGTWIRSVDVIYAARPVGGQLKDSFEGRSLWIDPAVEKHRIAFDFADVIESELKKMGVQPGLGSRV